MNYQCRSSHYTDFGPRGAYALRFRRGPDAAYVRLPAGVDFYRKEQTQRPRKARVQTPQRQFHPLRAVMAAVAAMILLLCAWAPAAGRRLAAAHTNEKGASRQFLTAERDYVGHVRQSCNFIVKMG